MLMSFSETIAAHMLKYGYTCTVSGTILGVAYMGLKAILSNDIHNFSLRIENIRNIIKNTEQTELRHLRSFYNEVQLSNDLYLENSKDTYRSKAFIDIYRTEELISFFEKLKRNSSTQSQSSALIVYTVNFVLAIGFDSAIKKWVVLNPEDCSVHLFSSEASIVKLMTSSIKDNFIGAFLKVYSSSEDKYQAEALFQKINCALSDNEERKHVSINRNEFLLLHMAVANNQLEMVTQLINHKRLDVNQQSHNGFAPLHIASKEGYVDIVRILLLHKAEVNILDCAGETPLHKATRNNHLKILDILIDCPNIEVNLKNNKRLSALGVALELHHKESIKKLLQHPDIDISQHIGYAKITPLCFAVQENFVEAVDMLLEHPNIDVNKISNNHTPLSLAISQSNLNLVKKLLAHKNIDINNLFNSYNTPLIAALIKEEMEIVKVLLNHNDIDINQPNRCGASPLLVAVQLNMLEIAALLLQMNANVNQHTFGNTTALSTALEQNNVIMTKMLLVKGALFGFYDIEKISELVCVSKYNLINRWEEKKSQNQNLPLLHTELIKDMMGFGYSANELGMCQGITFMGLQAILVRELEKFDERLNLIKRNINRTEKLKKEDLIDLLAFYDGVQIHQMHKVCPLLVDKKWRKNIQGKNVLDDGAADLMQSIAMDNRGGLYSPDNFSGAFTNKELSMLLENLKKSLNNKISEPIGLLLSSTCHIMVLGFDPLTQEWIFIDSNCLPVKRFESEDIVSEKINYALQAYEEFNLISITLYSIRLIKEQIDSIAQEWRKCSYHVLNKAITENRIKATKEREESVLALAAIENDIELVKLLLSYKDIDINKQCNNGKTPLLLALHEKHFDIARELLEQDTIDVNRKDNHGLSPLLSALQTDNEIFDLLLAHKDIDVNIKNNMGVTPLFYAAEKGLIELAKKMINHPDIDVNKITSGYTPLTVAIISKNIEIVMCLLQHERIDVNLFVLDNVFAPLHIATQSENIKAVRELLKHENIIVNKRNCYGQTALYIATNRGCNDIIKLLLQQENIDPNIPGNDCCMQHLSTQYDTNTPEQPVSDGFAPLHIASFLDNLEAVKMLLDLSNTNVNAQSNAGVTALHIAAYHGNVRVVQALLMRNDLNMNIIDNNGMTALHIAAERMHEKIIDVLINHDHFSINMANSLLCWAIEKKHTALAVKLLRCGNIDVNSTINGDPILFSAIEKNDIHIVNLLSNHPDIDIFRVNRKGETPLGVSLKKDDLDMVQVLFNKNILKRNALIKTAELSSLPSKRQRM